MVGRFAFALALLGVVACAGRPVTPSAPLETASRTWVGNRSAAASKIQHVVFIIQENRSFNFMFNGYPGALTKNYGYDTSGKKVFLHPEELNTDWDIDHSLTAFLAVVDNGKYDGWNNQNACCNRIPKNFAYAYAKRHEVLPYWRMAESYVLADHMFQSNLDGSFVAHQYAIAGYASSAVDFTTGAWGCSGGSDDTVLTITQQRTYGPSITPCFDNPTIGDEADAAGVSWRYYAAQLETDGGIWSAYQAINHIYNGSDWSKNVISPASQFLTDVAGGTLANITWITPTGTDSDHAGIGFASRTGPAWVASLVNAVGQSQFWDSTAIFIMWDDWGGWFDPVPPVYEDYDGLGFRVPLIVVSPYAKAGYVAHAQYETASVLRFIEDNFGLGQLAASDTRAADPGPDVFDFTAAPRPFEKIPGAKPSAYWLSRKQNASSWHHGSPAGGD